MYGYTVSYQGSFLEMLVVINFEILTYFSSIFFIGDYDLTRRYLSEEDFILMHRCRLLSIMVGIHGGSNGLR